MRKFVFVIALAAVLVAGYFGYQRYYDSTGEQAYDQVVYQNGNSSGNIANSGYIARYKDQLIGNINPENQGIYKSNLKFKKQVKLTDDEGLFINTDGIWVYYVNYSDKHTIYRIRLDGKDRMKLNKSQSDALNWENGWLYYLDRSKGSIICKMSADGKTSNILLDQKYCSNLIVKDGWVYYIQKGQLQRINIDGGNHRNITKIRTTYYDSDVAWRGNYDVDGYYIYYPGENGCLYRIRIDGKQKILVKRGKMESINVYENYVYFYNTTQKTIYRFNVENPNDIDYVIGGGLYYNINIVNNDGVLYKDKSIMDGPLYMVLMDLTPKTKNK